MRMAPHFDLSKFSRSSCESGFFMPCSWYCSQICAQGRLLLRKHHGHLPLRRPVNARIRPARFPAIQICLGLLERLEAEAAQRRFLRPSGARFGELDPRRLLILQEQLLQLQASLNKTIVFITHDLDEALRLGNRIAILRDGCLLQEGTPSEIVQSPADDHVRRFVEKRETVVL